MRVIAGTLRRMLGWFGGPTVALLDDVSRGPRTDQAEVLQALAERWRHYHATPVDRTVSPHDDMYSGEPARIERRYLRVGVSALEVIAEAMLLARRTRFGRILDLPCGGGRATRHLVKFFPEAEIFVSDVEPAKQDFVVRQFGVRAAAIPEDFALPPKDRFDLIFMGSLVTHLDRRMFGRTLDYCIEALEPEGLLVVTTSGRQVVGKLRRKDEGTQDPAVLRAIRGPFLTGGFAYVEEKRFRDRYSLGYGATFCTPAWVMRQAQSHPDALILGFKERAWNGAQDVLIVQRLARSQARRADEGAAAADPD